MYKICIWPIVYVSVRISLYQVLGKFEGRGVEQTCVQRLLYVRSLHVLEPPPHNSLILR